MIMACILFQYQELSRMFHKELMILALALLSLLTVEGRYVSKQQLAKRSSVPGGNGRECTSFLNLPDRLTMNRDVMKKVGEGYPPEHCKEACLSATDFTCVAAQVQLPATCFITGYKIRYDYYSTHYRRVCDHGPQCFVESESSTAGGFSESLPVPWYYQSYPALQPIFCMAQCEQMEGCIGFDLRSDNKRPRCVFLSMDVIPDSSFELYIRRC